MDRLFARLERKLGRFAITNLTWYIVGLGAVVFLLERATPGFTSMLVLDPALVMRGEVWRLVTYLFIPPSSSPFWILFALYMTWMVGTSLEAEWGAFRLNLFYFSGMAAMTAAAFLTGQPATNIYLNATLFLAFATLYPDFQILLFFVLPIRVKWVGWATAGWLMSVVLLDSMGAKAAALFALVNYLLFFQGTIRALLRRGTRRVASVAQRSQLEAPRVQVRKCSLCGKTDADPSVDIRVCSCERCGKPTELCLEHARNH